MGVHQVSKVTSDDQCTKFNLYVYLRGFNESKQHKLTAIDVDDNNVNIKVEDTYKPNNLLNKELMHNVWNTGDL